MDNVLAVLMYPVDIVVDTIAIIPTVDIMATRDTTTIMDIKPATNINRITDTITTTPIADITITIKYLSGTKALYVLLHGITKKVAVGVLARKIQQSRPVRVAVLLLQVAVVTVEVVTVEVLQATLVEVVLGRPFLQVIASQ